MIITKEILKFFKVALNIIRKKAIVEGVYISDEVMYAANIECQAAYILEQKDITKPIVIPSKAAEYIISFPVNSKLEFLVKDSCLTIKSGRTKVRFSLLEGNTYPKRSKKEDLLLSVNAGKFVESVKASAIAGDCNSPNTRVKCVHISVRNGKLISSATDGKKLAFVDIVPANCDMLEKCEITFPIAHIGYLSMFECADNIEINYANHKRAVTLKQDDFELSSTLIECSDINSLISITESIKNGTGNTFVVEQESLKTVLSRIALLSSVNENKIKCVVSGDTFAITNMDTTTACEQVIDITDSTSNSEVKMCLNLKDFKELVGSVDGEIKVICAGGDKPVLLEAENKLFLMTQFRC